MTEAGLLPRRAANLPYQFRYSRIALHWFATVLPLALAVSACTPEIALEPTRKAAYAVHGYVDGLDGVTVEVTETLPADASDFPVDPSGYLIDDASVRLRFGSVGAGIDIPEGPTRGSYRLAGPLPSAGPVELVVEVRGSRLRSIGTIPPTLALEYDSISTAASDQDVFGNDVPDDSTYLVHVGTYRSLDSLLSLVIRPPSNAPDRELRTAEPESTIGGCVTWSGGELLAMTAGCIAGEARRVTVGSGADTIGQIQFLVSQSPDQDFPIYLQALEQFSSTDLLGGIFELIPAPSNVAGGGGYVYFSNSRVVTARAEP